MKVEENQPSEEMENSNGLENFHIDEQDAPELFNSDNSKDIDITSDDIRKTLLALDQMGLIWADINHALQEQLFNAINKLGMDVLKIIAAGAGHWSPFPKTQFTIVWG